MISMLFAAADRTAALLADLRALAWCAGCTVYVCTRERITS